MIGARRLATNAAAFGRDVECAKRVIGSTNLDYCSIEYNLEISAIIRSAEFGRQMHDLFDNDVRYAKEDPARGVAPPPDVGPIRAVGGDPGPVRAVVVPTQTADGAMRPARR